MDIIFSLRQLQEKCVEQQRRLYITFMDLTKHLTPFVEMDCESCYQYSDALHTLPTSSMFHEGMEGHINIFGELFRPISHQQQCKTVLCLDTYSVWTIPHCCSSGHHLRTEGRGLPTNEDRWWTSQPCKIESKKRKVRDITLHELQFADACALVTHLLEDLQITSHFASAAKDFRLTISLKKTEVCTSQLLAHAI